MFERFTEQARKALFFARFATSEFEGTAVETEHLLLGVLRAATGLTADLCARGHVSFDSVRRRIPSRPATGPKVSISVEIPFSEGTTRILEAAAAEADRVGHPHICTEHLLVGILCGADTDTAHMLVAEHLRLEAVRQEVARVARSV
jgi:ATP-dependent Clp protease ATP-binding subunit ClpC